MLGTTGNSEVTQPGASTWNEYCWMPKREQQKALSSGRNESQNPSAQGSGDRLQSTLKENDDVRNLLSLGVELILVTRVHAKSQENVRKEISDELPNKLSNVVRLRT